MVDITPDNVESVLAGLVAKTRHVDVPETDDPTPSQRPANQSRVDSVDDIATGSDNPDHVAADDVPGLLDSWSRAVAGITAAPLARMTDRALTDELIEADRLRRSSDAAFLRLVAEVDARKAAPASAIGAVSTANLLTAGCGHSPSRAKSDVDAARALYTRAVETSALVPTVESGPLAGMSELLESGDIRIEHVQTALHTLERIPDRLATDDTATTIVGFFAEHAPTTSPRTLGKLAEQLLGQLDPPDDDFYDPEAFNRRSLRITTDMLGMVHGTYQFDPLAGAEFAAMIDSLSAPRPDQKDEQGNIIAHDDRNPGQRRADALGEVIHSAATNLGIRLPSGDAADSPSRENNVANNGPNASGAPDQGLFDLPTAQAGDSSGGRAKTGGRATSGGSAGACESAPGTSRAGRFRPGRRQPRIVIVTTEDQLRTKRETREHRGRQERDQRAGTSDCGNRHDNTSAGNEADSKLSPCRYRPVDPSRSYCPHSDKSMPERWPSPRAMRCSNGSWWMRNRRFSISAKRYAWPRRHSGALSRSATGDVFSPAAIARQAGAIAITCGGFPMTA